MCVHDKLQPFTCQDGTHWDDAQKVLIDLLQLSIPSFSIHNPFLVIHPPSILRFATTLNSPAAPVTAVLLLLLLPLPGNGNPVFTGIVSISNFLVLVGSKLI